MIKLFLFLLLPSIIFGNAKTATLYNSLDPKSIVQHLAFYELYPDSAEGKKALKSAFGLLSVKNMPNNHLKQLPISNQTAELLVNLITRRSNEPLPALSSSELQQIEGIASHLSNRRLKGYNAKNKEDLIPLPSEEIDLSRAVLLSQFGSDNMEKIRSYEAMIDLMALQIMARLSNNATPEDKIREINHLIFDEMRFRFPPHSLWAKDVDIYTFLPDILDSRYGVCLGVSVLYLSIANRLDLPLEIITPPGHIYIRLNDSLNIETTARGIHLDSENYLGVDTKALEERNLKEVIGLVHINEAAIYLKKEDYRKALECYEKAKVFLPDDMLLKELMGFCYLFTGQKKRGDLLLKQLENYVPPHSVSKSILISDYLQGNVGLDGIQAIFMEVDETKESILNKKKTLEEIVLKYPKFKDGILSLAVCWMQLHREKEALAVLETLHAMGTDDPTTEYYLAELNAGRLNYKQAWLHLKRAEEITSAKNHHPKALKAFRRQLRSVFPE